MSTVIDDADWDLVKGYRWTAHRAGSDNYFYAIHHWEQDGVRKHVLLHRLILGLTDRKILVDHKDGDGLNNRRDNLRICTHAENMRNSKLRCHSRSGIKGVSLQSVGGGLTRWKARVTVDGKRFQKWFTSPEEAETWAIGKRAELHGDFAVENR